MSDINGGYGGIDKSLAGDYRLEGWFYSVRSNAISHLVARGYTLAESDAYLKLLEADDPFKDC